MSTASLFCLAGVLLVFAAGSAFYLAANQQQLLKVRPASRACILAGGLFALLASMGFVAATDRLAGCLMTMAGLMLVLSLLPVVVALYRQRGARP